MEVSDMELSNKLASGSFHPPQIGNAYKSLLNLLVSITKRDLMKYATPFHAVTQTQINEQISQAKGLDIELRDSLFYHRVRMNTYETA